MNHKIIKIPVTILMVDNLPLISKMVYGLLFTLGGATKKGYNGGLDRLSEILGVTIDNISKGIQQLNKAKYITCRGSKGLGTSVYRISKKGLTFPDETTISKASHGETEYTDLDLLDAFVYGDFED